MLRIGAINDELSPSWPSSLDLAVELGIQDIEIHTYQSRCIEEICLEEIRVIHQELLARGLKVCNLSTTVFLRCRLDPFREDLIPPSTFHSIGGTYADHLHALQSAFEIAQTLEAPYLRIFGFWKEVEFCPDVLSRTAGRLEKPVQMAQEMGIPLVLENCPHTCFDWGERAIELVEMIDSPWLKMLWDPCAAVRSGEPDIFAAYPRIFWRLAHVHAKDFRFKPGSRRGHSYLPVGQGQVDWKGILSRLISDGYEGVIAIETHHQGADGRRETGARATHKGLTALLEEQIEDRWS